MERRRGEDLLLPVFVFSYPLSSPLSFRPVLSVTKPNYRLRPLLGQLSTNDTVTLGFTLDAPKYTPSSPPSVSSHSDNTLIRIRLILTET